MKKIVTISALWIILIGSQSFAQTSLPIIDMHFHAANFDDNGPPHTGIGRIRNVLPEVDYEIYMSVYLSEAGKILGVRGKSISLGVVDLPIGASYEKDFFRVYMKDSF